MHQFESETGDYTKECALWLKEYNIDSILDEILKKISELLEFLNFFNLFG
ncbi:MAG: hypothetical protein ACTSRG_19645 [Candidatus Helarchaeota archaeon]